MVKHKLVLVDDVNEDFSLIAIHCSEEAYKMAFMLNKHLNFKLARKPLDVDFSNKGLDVSFPIFEYEDNYTYILYHLVANKCKSLSAKVHSSGGLFDEFPSKKTVTTFLLNDYKKVDFFLKIHSDYERVPVRNLISSINEIEQVISAYSVENDKIKTKNNLIFN